MITIIAVVWLVLGFCLGVYSLIKRNAVRGMDWVVSLWLWSFFWPFMVKNFFIFKRKRRVRWPPHEDLDLPLGRQR